MAKFIKRITLVAAEGPGNVLFKGKKKKKKRKVSKWLKPMERRQRRMAQAADVFGRESLRRHRRSNRKRKNGFLRDGLYNQTRAGRKAIKKLFRF